MPSVSLVRAIESSALVAHLVNALMASMMLGKSPRRFRPPAGDEDDLSGDPAHASSFRVSAATGLRSESFAGPGRGGVPARLRS